MIEISDSLLIVMTFLGLAHAERRGTYVRTAFVTDRLGAVHRKWARFAAYAFYLVIVAWWAVASVSRAVESTAKAAFRAGLVEFPVYPVRVVLAVGLVALTLMVVVRLVEILCEREVTPPEAVLPGA